MSFRCGRNNYSNARPRAKTIGSSSTSLLPKSDGSVVLSVSCSPSTRRPEFHFHAVSLNDIVHRVWETIGNQENPSTITVRLDLAEHLPPVLGDADQLQQVLLNLTVNAIEAVEGSGQITLGTHFVPALTGQQGRVEARVTDTGPGIAPEDESHIFDPFFTTKGAVGGTGLGLAISREIVVSHRGDLRVESTPGRGSCFFMSLPPAIDDTGFDIQEKEHKTNNDKHSPLADSRC